MEKQTSYAKLRPREPTPDKELCRCLDTPPIKLMHVLTENPLHCMNCNLEVPVETLALPQRIVEGISHWNEIYHATYMLWLDSGAYEAWAREQFTDITSTVNTRGETLSAIFMRSILATTGISKTSQRMNIAHCDPVLSAETHYRTIWQGYSYSGCASGTGS